MNLSRYITFIGLYLCTFQVHAQEVGQFWLQHNDLEPWEWGFDHDGDSFSSGQEYFLGTDPFDPNSTLVLSNSTLIADLLLYWNSAPGATYQIEESTNLVAFAPVLGPMLGTGSDMVTALPLVSLRGMYRIAALEPTDVDGDHLSSVEEAILGTDPNDPDTDNDTFPDGEEVLSIFTDPLVPNPLGGTIRGTVLNDPNNDGDLTDGAPVEGALVFMDANFNARFDVGERWELADASGDYEFLAVPPGIHHVRQELPPPNVQTFPATGMAPVFDMLPDEVLSYVHAAPGVGAFDVPYGRIASDWPGNWGDIDILGSPEPVPTDIVLNPIGARAAKAPVASYFGNEFLSMPEGAEITLRFDEAIIDGPGSDLIIYTGTPGTPVEEVEVFLGSDPANLVSIGIVTQDTNNAEIDLGSLGIAGPISVLRAVSLNSGGAFPGFEFIGVEVLNAAPADPDAHIVVVTSTEVFNDRDFGRYFRDLVPTLVMTAEDADPATPGLRVGENVLVRMNAEDDIEVASLSLVANGQTIPLVDGMALVTPSAPGSILLEGTVTDDAGQTTVERTRVYILNADGSFPFDPGVLGPNVSQASAPTVRILSPASGTVTNMDTEVIVEIVGAPASSWTVDYAPVDDIDPYDLNAPDLDYISLASGSGDLFSVPVATLPFSTLPDGIYFLRVCAENPGSPSSCAGQVIAKNVNGADLRPVITLDSPTNGTDVTITANVFGSINSTRPIREWTLDYARADLVDINNLGAPNANWKSIASGAAAVPSPAFLGNFDGTMLKSNPYILRLIAWNNIGMGRVEYLLVDVVGDAKLGRNRIEYKDIAVNLAGFPLQFVRVYDSLQADEDGELGFGWSFNLQDPDIRETVPVTGSGVLFGSTPFRDGTRVYITAPTGERLGFTFKPVADVGALFGSVYKATFEPDPGVYHSLEIPQGDGAFLSLNPDGTVKLAFFSFPWNPQQYVLTDPDNNRFTYDQFEGFLQAEDPNGNTISLNEDGIQHSDGLNLVFERDGQGRIRKVIDPAGGVWEYTYDAKGDLKTATDTENRTTTYNYLSGGDQDHYLESFIDPFGRMPLRFEYDPVTGRLLAAIDENGNRDEVNWDPAGFKGQTVDRKGNVTEFWYDERGNVTRRVDPENGVTLYEYSDPSNPDRETAIINASSNRYEQTFNERGQLTSYVRPGASGIAGAQRADMTYDDDGNLVGVNDLLSRRWSFIYDDRGNLTELDAPPGEEDEFNTYSPNGRLIHSSDDSGDGTQERYFYNSFGQLSRVTDDSGFDLEIELTRAGQPQSASFGPDYDMSFQYDEQGIPQSETAPGAPPVDTTQDADGNYVSSDSGGSMEEYIFAADQLLTRYANAVGSEVLIDYNDNRRLDKLTDPSTNVWRFGYNANDWPVSRTDPLGNAFTLQYDAVGNITQTVTRTGKTRSLVFDENRRPLAEHWLDIAGNIIRSFEYFYGAGDGALDRVTDTRGAVQHVHEFGLQGPNYLDTSVTYHGQPTYTLQYQYGPDYVSRVNLKQGITTLGQIEDRRHAGRTTELLWRHPGYSLFGTQNGNRIELRRDGLGRIKSAHRYTDTSSQMQSQSFYDYRGDVQIDPWNPNLAAGPASSSKPYFGVYQHVDENLNYLHPMAASGLSQSNGLRVIRSIGSNAFNVARIGYSLDEQVNSVTHSNPAFVDEHYAYEHDRRVDSHRHGATYVYGAANRLLSTSAYDYDYDDSGSLSRKTDKATGAVTDFEYDHRGQLISGTVYPGVGAPASTVVRFEYDYLGRLMSREINGSKTWIINDRHMPIAEFADGAPALNAMFFYSPNRIDAFQGVWREGLGERWFLLDERGSVRGIMDENANVLSYVNYDSFGNLQPGNAAADDEPCAYTGRFWVKELGLYEFRRRFFDPDIGRFIQEDPIGFRGKDYSLYRYVFNSPHNLRDPFGTSAATEQGLLDSMNAALIKVICKLGDCVGALWSGVVIAAVNKQPVDAVGQAGDCVAAAVAPIPDAFCDPLGALESEIQGAIDGERNKRIDDFLEKHAPSTKKPLEQLGKAVEIVELVMTCADSTIVTKERDEPGCNLTDILPSLEGGAPHH